jgi:predicted Zn-dependent protease
MMRRSAVGLAAGVLLALTGCLHDDWSIGEALGWEKVQTPNMAKYPPPDIRVAERVEQLGRQIIAQNTFTGLDPLFYTVGVPEPMLFHRGTATLYVSEGLVKQCPTDDELAAVLCTELGHMMAEHRAARGAGRDADQIPDVALPSTGTAFDQTRDAELALQAKQRTRTGTRVPAEDPAKHTRDLMRGAGYDPAELDRVAPLLKQSDRGEALRKQMAGSGPVPKWER